MRGDGRFDTGRRLFRQNGCVVLFGGLFVVFPLCCFSLPAFYHLATGTTIPIRNSKFDPNAHPSTAHELWTMALVPLIHVTVGLALIAFWSNATIVTDNEGISSRNMFGKKRFKAAWSEVSDVCHVVDGENHATLTIRVRGAVYSLPDTRDRQGTLCELLEARVGSVSHPS